MSETLVITGAQLLGRTYTPPMSYYAGHEGAFRVVAADDAVTTTDGSGLVHTAGAFGEIDKEVTDREGIAAVMPVAKDGRFTAPVTDYEGSGAHARVQVNFEEAGSKWLVLAYANLSPA